MSKTTGKGGDRETSIYFASKTTGERLKVPTSKIARFAAWCLAVQALTQWEGESADMAPVASEWEQWVNQFAK